MPPSGGPPDTTPPEVIATYPEHQTTNFNGARVTLEFSKYVDRRTVEESIFISPDAGPLEFDWSGREVEIRFDRELRQNITYVVTVGTDVTDLRNRNRMAEAFSLAFSTGAALDSASLSGRVFDPKAEGITIFAYRLENTLGDTLNPASAKPDYVTQTGSDGTFSLNYLAWGTYRLFAVRDQYKNILYVPQIDHIGMASQDFTMSPSGRTREGIQFQLTKEDTTSPFVLDAQAMHRNEVRVRISEVLDIVTIQPKAFSILDTLTNAPINSRDVFFTPGSANVVHITTDVLDSQKTYRVTVTGVSDTAGNRINPRSNAAVFAGSSIADTLVPRILSAGVQDSVRNVPYHAVFDVIVSEGIRKEPFEKGFRLLDSTGQHVEWKLHWWSPSAVRFLPREPLLPFAWYRIRIALDSVQDYAGNRIRDSLFVRSFQTVDWRKLGSMRGRVVDPVEKDAGPIYITATSISDKTAASIVKKLDAAGEFTFENVVEGLYVLRAFRDSDGNGKYTFGKPFPFMPSERFAVYPDTIKVRARWPVEGIAVRFGGK